MALGTFAPGPYTATYDASGAVSGTPGQSATPAARSLGLVDNVHRVSRTASAEDVRGTNLYGDTVVDSIYRGGNMFLLFTMKEWPAYVRDILWPFSSTFGAIGTTGRLMSDLAGKIVLTPQAGTPAYTNDGKIYTFGKAIISPEHNVELIHGPVQKDIALVFRCYPYDNGSGTIVWFTESAVE